MKVILIMLAVMLSVFSQIVISDIDDSTPSIVKDFREQVSLKANALVVDDDLVINKMLVIITKSFLMK